MRRLKFITNNLHKNQKGSIGKKLAIVGSIAVVLLAGAVVYVLNPFSDSYEIPTPAPYIPPTPKADLAVADVTYSQIELNKDGRIYEIELSIINKGDIASNFFSISVSGLEEELVVNNIEPGDTIPVVFNIDLLRGEQTIEIKLDPDNTVTEHNKYNNNRQLTIDVTPLSLEDLFPPDLLTLPEYGPATPDEIKKYMTYALTIDYETSRYSFPDLPKYVDNAGEKLSGEWVDRALHALKIDFTEEKYKYLRYAAIEWRYGGVGNIPAVVLASTLESAKSNAAKYAETSNKKGYIAAIKSGLETILGRPYGFGKK